MNRIQKLEQLLMMTPAVAWRQILALFADWVPGEERDKALRKVERRWRFRPPSVRVMHGVDVAHPCWHLVGTVYLQSPEVPDLTAHPHVTVLHLHHQTDITDLTQLATRAPQLNELNLCGIRSLRSLRGLSGLRDLYRLDASDCSNLEQIVELGPRLETVILENAGNLTDLEPLASITDLRVLNLRGHRALADISLVQRWPELRHVVLGFNDTMTDIDAFYAHRGLSVLSLARSTALRSIEGLRGMLWLKHLYLDGCVGLEDFSAVTELPSLVELSLAHLPQLRDLSPFFGLPSLRHIHTTGSPIEPRPTSDTLSDAELAAYKARTTVAPAASEQSSPPPPRHIPVPGVRWRLPRCRRARL